VKGTMRRTRNSPGRISNPLRELLAEKNRAVESARLRQREQALKEDLPSLIDERVGEQLGKLESKLVDSFRKMGQRVVEQGTEALTSQLDGRISQLEEISTLQTDTINHLRDSSRASHQKISGVVNSIEMALGDAVPGFRLPPPPAHLPSQLNPPVDARELVKSQDRSIEDFRVPDMYCPKCTSTQVRRATRSGMWEEFLRLFFIAPFRCRACRHKFYRF
jgi:hypothetical protein